MGAESSRRVALLGLGAGGLGFVTSTHLTARAQAATPVAGPHPLVGAWFFHDRTQPTMNEAHFLVSFSTDGTVTATPRPGDFSGGVGAWRPTTAQTAEANLAIFSTSTEYGEELATFHLKITVDADGMSLTTAVTFDNITASGTVDQDIDPQIQWNGLRITPDPNQVVGPPMP